MLQISRSGTVAIVRLHGRPHQSPQRRFTDDVPPALPPATCGRGGGWLSLHAGRPREGEAPDHSGQAVAGAQPLRTWVGPVTPSATDNGMAAAPGRSIPPGWPWARRLGLS